ncbi:hypothetical protein [Rhodococcus sp. APC 3903]|uniref:hypothetical protein n=1 Tax=Rhodococcus sp. APC 3903 TaxID=3035193 RepID=UPI0025B3E81F|nr:hypothetical protein [Rhodococcus sp. APC 3903]MDN3460882.1 hypothetical protein [Rhodococcus sp. APC 3903]
MSVDWDKVGSDAFERIVDALLSRKWRDIAEVTCPDGRGGDGGIDIEVRQRDRRRVYQLKYFPDGFSGTLRDTRQGQIRESFKRAMKLVPPPVDWTLVVPAKLTPTERTYVLEKLVRNVEAGTQAPTIAILDRVELDQLLIDFPDVYNFLGRDKMRSDVELYRLEEATLLSDGRVRALADRVRNLGNLADGTDLYWGFDIASAGGVVTISARPKDPQAHIKNPITVAVDGVFSSKHFAVQQDFERSVRFGASGKVVLPPEVVRNLRVEGPELIAGVHSNVEVHLEPLNENPHVGAPAELKFFDDDDLVSASHEGRVAYLNPGTVGFTLKIEFYEHLTVELLFPLDKSVPGEARLSYNFRRIRPADALGVIEILSAIRRGKGTCKAYIDDNFLMSMSFNEPAHDDTDDELTVLSGIAYDLKVVQEFCHVKFAIPDELTAEERIDLRVARILIDGHVVTSPNARTGTITLTGRDSPNLREVLTSGGQVSFTAKELKFSVGSKELVLGNVLVFHPRATALNGLEAAEALDAGRGEGFQVHLRPGDDPYFYLAMPRQMSNPTAPMSEWTLVGWSLSDITQPGTSEVE